MTPPPPKWVVDLNSGVPPKAKNAASIPDPPGYTSSKAVSGKQVCGVGALSQVWSDDV